MRSFPGNMVENYIMLFRVEWFRIEKVLCWFQILIAVCCFPYQDIWYWHYISIVSRYILLHWVQCVPASFTSDWSWLPLPPQSNLSDWQFITKSNPWLEGEGGLFFLSKLPKKIRTWSQLEVAAGWTDWERLSSDLTWLPTSEIWQI